MKLRKPTGDKQTSKMMPATARRIGDSARYQAFDIWLRQQLEAAYGRGVDEPLSGELAAALNEAPGRPGSSP